MNLLKRFLFFFLKENIFCSNPSQELRPKFPSSAQLLSHHQHHILQYTDPFIQQNTAAQCSSNYNLLYVFNRVTFSEDKGSKVFATSQQNSNARRINGG